MPTRSFAIVEVCVSGGQPKMFSIKSAFVVACFGLVIVAAAVYLQNGFVVITSASCGRKGAGNSTVHRFLNKTEVMHAVNPSSIGSEVAVRRRMGLRIIKRCIAVMNGSARNGNSFVLGNCKNATLGLSFTLLFYEDGAYFGRMRLQLNPKKCVQASYSGKLQHGTWLRVYRCDKHNHLQLFALSDKLRVRNTDLCPAYRGNQPTRYQHHIFLKKCSTLDYDWSVIIISKHYLILL